MSYNTLNIEIVRPYSSLKDRIITIENIYSLTLNESTCEELHYGETREDLLEKIEDLESELRDYKGV